MAVTPGNFQDRMIYYLKGAGQDQGKRIGGASHDLVHASHCWRHRIQKFLTTVAERGLSAPGRE